MSAAIVVEFYNGHNLTLSAVQYLQLGANCIEHVAASEFRIGHVMLHVHRFGFSEL